MPFCASCSSSSASGSRNLALTRSAQGDSFGDALLRGHREEALLDRAQMVDLLAGAPFVGLPFLQPAERRIGVGRVVLRICGVDWLFGSCGPGGVKLACETQ